ncbi:acyl-CoA dehydrogenase family protein [Pseudonocardia zijingensis]|jgi:alkylation response protein AidB-like acyl-CoA dehydrogenase|uniref:Acyl-CoA dehydrogenase family protein n=1 Tax=Pseudonocardia zijingensis TaxID=153376 RepID=A0ABN1PL77_9PSEU
MDLTLTEDQELIRSTARDVLAGRKGTAGVAAVAGDPAGFSADLWKEMVELGWTGLAVPETYGGVGEGFVEACLLLEEMGAAQVPSPFLHTVVCGATIERHGSAEQRERWLTGIAEGRTIAFADGAAVAAAASGDGYVLDGTARFVPFAHAVDALLVVAGPTAFLVDRTAAGVSTERLDVIGPNAENDVRFSGVAVPADRVLGGVGDGAAVAATAAAFGAAATSAEMAGGAQRVLDLSVEYAGQREQFGRPIGSFQAVQHHCADMAIDVLTARFIAFEAIWRLGAPGQDAAEVALTVAVAKSWVSDAYQRVCALGHQVHGAIGFTAEHELHHYLQHATSSALAFGDGDFHADRVADGIGLPAS